MHFPRFSFRPALLRLAKVSFRFAVDIWYRHQEMIRKRTDISEHFTREVIQSIVFIVLPLGESMHLTN